MRLFLSPHLTLPGRLGVSIVGRNDWIPVAPGWAVKPESDGKYSVRRRGSLRRYIERNRAMQKAAKEHPSMTETKGGFMRQIASYPEDVAQEIHEKCGADPEKQAMFLRDHPEFLVVPREQAGIPSKKIVIYPRRADK